MGTCTTGRHGSPTINMMVIQIIYPLVSLSEANHRLQKKNVFAHDPVLSMRIMSAKPPDIFPRAYVSTFPLIGPRTFLNIYKILNIGALYALMTVLAS